MYKAKKRVRSFQVTPTIYIAGAMAVGDAMAAPIEIEDILQYQGAGHIKSVIVADKDKQSMAFDALFFKALPTGTFTLGAAADLDDASLLDYIGHVSINASNYVELNDNSVGGREAEIPFSKEGKSVIRDSGASARSLWMLLIANGTDTFTNADALTITVNIETD